MMRLIRAQAREAQKGDTTDGVLLLLVSIAALLRGVASMLGPDLLAGAMMLAGAAWSLAAFLTLALYARRLGRLTARPA